jgi:hypothetical protein
MLTVFIRHVFLVNTVNPLTFTLPEYLFFRIQRTRLFWRLWILYAIHSINRDDTSKMKHMVLLLGLILCGRVNIVLSSALEENQGDLGPTGSEQYQYVRRHVQRSAPRSPVVSTRILQLEADPGLDPGIGSTTSPPAPTAPPMSEKDRADPDPCPSSSSCRADYNLMHKSCVTSCVHDARVQLKMLAGWVCGRCR